MTSPLERVPYDVLLNITFNSASSTICGPPKELLNLRLTCKTLHRSLSVAASAQLYARLFRCHFDFSPLLLNSYVTLLNDSTLANEYVLRQRFLSHSRRSSWATTSLASDMWVALRMLLESSDINAKQLVTAKFPEELLKLAQVHLTASPADGDDLKGLSYLLVWLLSLMLSNVEIANIPVETREQLCCALRLYIATNPITSSGPSFMTAFYDLRSKAAHVPSHGEMAASTSGSQNCHQGSTLYSQYWIPVESLNPSFAAINVIFAMKEACPLLIPPHLPESRAIAHLQHQTSGPTMEDFREFQSYRTPLFADSLSCKGDIVSGTVAAPVVVGRSRSHELSRLYGANEAQGLEAGTFSGLWQGSYMTYTVDEGGAEGYSHRRPLQVNFTEYHCYSPGIPLPPVHDASDLASLPTQPWDVDNPMAQKHRYERDGTTLQRSAPTVSQFSGAQKPMVILDTILFGETTAEHDAAWKGFRYVGRIRQGGMVYLKREPKNQSEDYLGTWIFEGRLRFGKALMGSWRAQNSTDSQGARGIFSLVKATNDRH